MSTEIRRARIKLLVDKAKRDEGLNQAQFARKHGLDPTHLHPPPLRVSFNHHNYIAFCYLLYIAFCYIFNFISSPQAARQAKASQLFNK